MGPGFEPLRAYQRDGKVITAIPSFGEMAEWSIAPVLKTDVLRGTGGSNPSLSANNKCSGERIGAVKSLFLIRQCQGRLAQLVQSVCLTSRGSAVRIRQRPQKHDGSLAQLNRAFDYGSKGYRFESYRSHTRVQASSYWVDTRVAKWGRL